LLLILSYQLGTGFVVLGIYLLSKHTIISSHPSASVRSNSSVGSLSGRYLTSGSLPLCVDS